MVRDLVTVSQGVPYRPENTCPAIIAPGLKEKVVGLEELGDEDEDMGFVDDVEVGSDIVISNTAWGQWWLEIAKQGEDGILPMPHSNATPGYVSQVKYLIDIMKEHMSWAAAYYLGQFKFLLQSIKKIERSDAQKWVMQHYTWPEWAIGLCFKDKTGRVLKTPRSVLEAQMNQAHKSKGKSQAWDKIPMYTGPDHLTQMAKDMCLMKDGEIHPYLGDPTAPQHTHHPVVWKLWAEKYCPPGMKWPL
jgi:hypothetical protein